MYCIQLGSASICDVVIGAKGTPNSTENLLSGAVGLGVTGLGEGAIVASRV